MEPCCIYKMQTHLLLTVKEGGNVILVLGKRQKPFKFQVKLLNHLQCRVNPCVYREEKGDNDNPYCY